MKEKIKLCLIAPVPPPYGGIGNWVLLLKEHIKKRNDIDMDIISTAPVGRGLDGRTLWDRIVTQGVLMIKKDLKLKQIIKKNHPDVIHITTSGQLAVIRDIMLLKTARKRKIPTVYHIRFGRINDIAEQKTSEWKLISKAMKLASEVIVIDRTTHEAINKYLPSVKVVYIPNPIDIANISKPKIINSKTIMFLGWVVNTKGIEELLTAWENVHKRHKDWQLRLVGPYKDEYYAYLKNHYSLQGVIFEGEKDHKVAMDLLNNSEIFVLPSYTEGFPNAILEAMAFSKPIIATLVGAIPEMLSSNCGILIEPKSAKEVENGLEGLISDREQMVCLGINAYNKLKNEYVVEKIFDRYMEEWQKVTVKE